MTQPSAKASGGRGRKGAGFGDHFASAISHKNHISGVRESATVESLFDVATVTINAPYVQILISHRHNRQSIKSAHADAVAETHLYVYCCTLCWFCSRSLAKPVQRTAVKKKEII